MDDSAQVDMDTDVSSTTADVPESQEVSHGKVEMVIVVEQVVEEDMNDDNAMNSSEISEKSNNVVEPSSKQSPHKDGTSVVTNISPGKLSQQSNILKSTPTKKDLPQITLKSSLDELKKSDTQSEDIVDSSITSLTLNNTRADISESKMLAGTIHSKTTHYNNIEKSESEEPVGTTQNSNPSLETTDSIGSEKPVHAIQTNVSPLKSTNKIDPNTSVGTSKNMTSSNKSINAPEKLINVIQIKKSPLKHVGDIGVKKLLQSTHNNESKKLLNTIQTNKSPFKNMVNNDRPVNNVIHIKKNSFRITGSNESGILHDTTQSKISPLKSLVNNISKKHDIIISKISPMKNLVNNDSPNPNVESKKSLLKNTVHNDSEKPYNPTISKTLLKRLSLDEPKTSPLIEEPERSNTKISNDEKEEIICNVSVDICEKTNDSQVQSVSDVTEKEYNKGISRELKSLINSAKESKIISECTQLTSKTRKSRAPLDASITNLNTSVDADKILSRRSSNHSQNSENPSEPNEKAATKRSMRSQNPEFVNKVKQFLNSVTGKCQKGESDDERTEESKKDKNATMSPSPKRKKPNDIHDQLQDKKSNIRSDLYCWRCHWTTEQATSEKAHAPLQCKVCPRSYHYKCLSGTEKTKLPLDKTWICPECLGVLHAESSDTRSQSMKKISLGLLCELLQYALQRMMDLNVVEPFTQPVDKETFPDYDNYVVHPMDLSLIKASIAENLYGSTEAFLADVQWILHNSIIFNTLQSKLTAAARTLVRTCRAEIGEIEACPECYAAAHARRPTWFTDVCSTPHILLWAKLKGFPYWPAKAMSVNSAGLVDVRFFGAHDRAWVPAKVCFLYSEKDPNNFRTKRQDILDSMQEAELHIHSISQRYGKFVYPPFKTQFDPTIINEQLKMMIPSFEGKLHVPVEEKSSINSPYTKKGIRSSSKNSSIIDGDMSDCEETRTAPSRKMSGGAEIAREEEDMTIEKTKTTDKEVQNKDKVVVKKRRRSELEEAVIAIIDSSSSEKKKRVEKDKSDKTEQQKDTSTKATINVDPENDNGSPTSTSKETPNKEPSLLVKKDTTTDTKQEKLTHKIKIVRTSTSRDKDNKANTTKFDVFKIEKTPRSEKEKTNTKHKSEKRRHSRNKSLDSKLIVKAVKSYEKKDKNVNNKHDIMNRSKDSASNKNKEDSVKLSNNVKTNSTGSTITTKNNIQFDDDTTLAVIARKTADSDGSRLPTISCVRSLSNTTQNSNTKNKSIEGTVDSSSELSIITPASTGSESVNVDSTLIGKVGVRAFARMTSTEKTPPKETAGVEIKGEPIDFDDADRQVEKMDLMNAFRLRPVNPPIISGLRDVRINKVVVAPLIRKPTTRPPEVRVKARKTFPQPRKPDERSELNGKNSMVYIPIQPPTTQAPIRTTRTITINTNATVRPQITTISTGANNIVNTLTAPLVSTMSSTSNHVPTTTVLTNIQNSLQCGPTMGHVPNSVHTVPLITSVNGQCFFSLQPVMSVGGVDNTSSNRNEVTDRSNTVLPVPVANSSPHVTTGHVTSVQPVTNGDATPEMPRLQQRPLVRNPLDVQLGSVPTPSTAGTLTAKLNQNATKLTDFFRTLMEDTLEKVDEPVSRLTSMKLQLEQAQWRHQQEIKELKHIHELTVMEMRAAHEKDKARNVNEARLAVQAELDAAVKAAKTKQWCANCCHEAHYYCCWNTSYCDYPCQRAHWSQHVAQCTQQRIQDTNSTDTSSLEKRLQPAPDKLPKNTSSQALTVGGKVANRVFSKEPNTSPKASIIVSMVDDSNGGQAVKCLGTYKPGAPAQLPLLINKQVITSEDSGKKVVTSGGYLIVGSGNGASIVAPRRTHTIQYFS